MDIPSSICSIHVMDCSAKDANLLLTSDRIELCLRILTGVDGFLIALAALRGVLTEHGEPSAVNKALFGVRAAIGDDLNKHLRALKELSLVNEESSSRLLFVALFWRQQELSSSISAWLISSESLRPVRSGDEKFCEKLKPESCESCEFCEDEKKQRSKDLAAEMSELV